MTEARVLKVGVSGLGRGFMLMLPTFRAHPGVRLVAAADPRPAGRARFADEFGGRAYEGIDGLCADTEVDLIYIAAPHQFHEAQAIAALAAGKHVLVEKPMALTLAECARMAAAAAAAGRHLIVGPSHGFDTPVARAAALIESGAFGALRMVTAFNFTDYLYRPRRPEELDSEQGGGVVFGQAVHQIDVVRRLVRAPIHSVRGQVGAWDPDRPADGAYNAFLDFAGGVTATLTYSGYGHFDSDEFCDWVGETGQRRDPDDYGAGRRKLKGLDPVAEAALRTGRGYGADAPAAAPPRAAHHEHFGFVLASCEKADLRILPTGVTVYGDAARWIEPMPAPDVPRREVIDEAVRAVFDGVPPVHDARWGLETMKAALALKASSRAGREIEI